MPVRTFGDVPEDLSSCAAPWRDETRTESGKTRGVAWRSDALLDDWKRRTGSPLLMRIGVAGFVWIASLTVVLRIDSDPLAPLFLAFWLVAAVSLIYQVFIRARISFWDQYRHPIAWLRFSLWLGWFPGRTDTPIEKVAAIAALAGAIPVSGAMFLSAR